MRIEKDQISKLLISIILSLLISIIISLTDKSISIVFCMEAFVLFAFFINIIINVKDRFFPFSFFLLSVFLGFLDVVFVVTDLRIVSNKYTIDIYEQTLLIFIIWIFMFTLAYFFKEKKAKQSNFRELKMLNNVIKSINVKYIVIISLLIQFFIAFKIINTVRLLGGITIAMNDFAVFRYNNQGYLTTLFPLLSLVSISLYEEKYKKLSIISMIINFCLITITGRRGLAINTVIIPFLVYYNYKIKKINNKTILIFLIPVIIFIMFVGGIRNQQITYGSNNSLIKVLTYLTNAIQYGQNIPDMLYKMNNGIVKFQRSKYIFNGFLGMIPRAIWSNKPETDSSLITSRVIYSKDILYGKPVGVFGFAYFSYGYLGVVISGLICGYFSCLLYKWMLKTKGILPVLSYSVLIQSFLSITNPDSQAKIIILFVIFIFITFVTSIKNGKIKFRERRKNEK